MVRSEVQSRTEEKGREEKMINLDTLSESSGLSAYSRNSVTFETGPRSSTSADPQSLTKNNPIIQPPTQQRSFSEKSLLFSSQNNLAVSAEQGQKSILKVTKKTRSLRQSSTRKSQQRNFKALRSQMSLPVSSSLNDVVSSRKSLPLRQKTIDLEQRFQKVRNLSEKQTQNSFHSPSRSRYSNRRKTIAERQAFRKQRLIEVLKFIFILATIVSLALVISKVLENVLEKQEQDVSRQKVQHMEETQSTIVSQLSSLGRHLRGLRGLS